MLNSHGALRESPYHQKNKKLTPVSFLYRAKYSLKTLFKEAAFVLEKIVIFLHSPTFTELHYLVVSAAGFKRFLICFPVPMLCRFHSKIL